MKIEIKNVKPQDEELAQSIAFNIQDAQAYGAMDL